MKNHIEIPRKYKKYQYLLVLVPHEDLRNKIKQVRETFNKSYEIETGLSLNGNITLVTFRQYDIAEEKIINRLRIISMGFQPCKIELKDFGSFPSHTIYINVSNKLTIQTLVKQIRTETQRLMKPDEENKPYFIMDPHITIAHKLLPWQFEKGWLEYSHKHFTGKFIADGMLLLRRSAGEKKYQVIQSFEFQDLPVATVQGSLFK